LNITILLHFSCYIIYPKQEENRNEEQYFIVSTVLNQKRKALFIVHIIKTMPTNPQKSAVNSLKKHGTAEFISLWLWTANHQIKTTAHARDILLI
jgi:hypothetical protein